MDELISYETLFDYFATFPAKNLFEFLYVSAIELNSLLVYSNAY